MKEEIVAIQIVGPKEYLLNRIPIRDKNGIFVVNTTSRGKHKELSPFYLSLGMTLDNVINDPSRKMGHAFVLAMLLQDEKVWLNGL